MSESVASGLCLLCGGRGFYYELADCYCCNGEGKNCANRECDLGQEYWRRKCVHELAGEKRDSLSGT